MSKPFHAPEYEDDLSTGLKCSECGQEITMAGQRAGKCGYCDAVVIHTQTPSRYRPRSFTEEVQAEARAILGTPEQAAMQYDDVQARIRERREGA